MSSAPPGVALRLTLRATPLFVATAPRPHRSVCTRPLRWSHSGQPMKHPWLYQYDACPFTHGAPVRFEQLWMHGSPSGVGGVQSVMFRR